MKPTPILSSLLALTLMGSAWGADFTISTGKEGGGYYGIGQRLAEVMAEQDTEAQVITSVGSVENLNRLNDPDSPVNVTLTQADALKDYLNQNPDFESRLLMLGNMGQECVFIVAGQNSGIEDDGDLQREDNDFRISVQSPDSGVAVTWQYMTSLEEGFKNTQPAFVDTLEALLEIKSGGGRIKAAMMVQRPDAKSPAMQVVLDNPDVYRFVEVNDWDLNDKLPDGSAVYTFETVTVQEKSWGFDTKVDTICTHALLVTNREKLSADLRSRLARVVLLAEERLKGR
ncbi:MAG: TAXI family TRAP transporter solute-binding subunit [Candidatus Competibacteraceae bacterium]|nr:TAXI family TRAP transporter solute-binding subunit [Candidatus Competibacteraceae bacterium]